MTDTFACGHPRTPENSIHSPTVRKSDGTQPYYHCRFCHRVRMMAATVERRQQRINDGLPVDGRSGSRAWL